MNIDQIENDSPRDDIIALMEPGDRSELIRAKDSLFTENEITLAEDVVGVKMCHQIPSNAKILVLLTVLCNSNPQTIPAATDNCYGIKEESKERGPQDDGE